MAEAQVPVQAAVPAAQALVQPPAAPANVDNPQQNPAPLQVLISFLVICSLNCFIFFPESSSPCYSPSLVCTRFICQILCFASQTPGLCSAPIHLCFQLPVLPKWFHIPSNGSLKGCLIALVGLLTLRLPSLGWVLTRLLCHFYLISLVCLRYPLSFVLFCFLRCPT